MNQTVYLIPGTHVEITKHFLGSNRIDESIWIDFSDLGDYFSCVGSADDGVDDLFVFVGKRALTVYECCAMSAGGVDHGADSVRHIGYHKESALLIGPVQEVEGLG